MHILLFPETPNPLHSGETSTRNNPCHNTNHDIDTLEHAPERVSTEDLNKRSNVVHIQGEKEDSYFLRGLSRLGLKARLLRLAASSLALSFEEDSSSVRPVIGNRPSRVCLGGQVCWTSFAPLER